MDTYDILGKRVTEQGNDLRSFESYRLVCISFFMQIQKQNYANILLSN